MGNHYSSASCRKKSEKATALSKYIAVVVVAGECTRTVEMEVPSTQASMKVGELLLEFPPAHFIAHFQRSSLLLQRPASMSASSSAQFQERPSPLGADADAMPGAEHVYVLLPMHRLHTRLTRQEHLILARLLTHNDTIAAQHQQPVIEEKSKVQLLRPRRSCTKRVMCSLRWGRRKAAARVAPHVDIIDVHHHDHDDEQEGKRRSVMAENKLGQVAFEDTEEEEEELEELCVVKQDMMKMKAKPWAPKLETISEAYEECP